MAVNLRGGCFEDLATGSLAFPITLTGVDAADLRSLADGGIGGSWLGREVVRAMCVAYNDDRTIFARTAQTPPPPADSGVALDEGEYVLVL